MKNTLVPLYKKININEELSEGRDVKNVALDIETKGAASLFSARK